MKNIGNKILAYSEENMYKKLRVSYIASTYTIRYQVQRSCDRVYESVDKCVYEEFKAYNKWYRHFK